MLVLTRKEGEVVMIGDDVRIVVARVFGDKVRLGFEAPPLVPIHRKEYYDEIKREAEEPRNLNDES